MLSWLMSETFFLFLVFREQNTEQKEKEPQLMFLNIQG